MTSRTTNRARALRIRRLRLAGAALAIITALLGAFLFFTTTSSPSISAQAQSQAGGTVTVFDNDIPTVGNLKPELKAALQRAAKRAARDGVHFLVNSGWRSAKEQEQLLAEAIVHYGSAEEAARWVATPKTSEHVSGDAVDIGPYDAVDWLAEHGAQYGLCQIYDNEAWHFELRPKAVESGCPRKYFDPTDDPRMQAQSQQ